MFNAIADAYAAVAAEPALRDPLSISWLTYLWVLTLAGLGGFVNFIGKVRRGESRAVNFAELVGEVATSGFVGLLTFWVCEWQRVDPLLAPVFIGICGHMGSRALFFFEKALESYITKRWPDFAFRPAIIVEPAPKRDEIL